jgi:hypothetical protein
VGDICPLAAYHQKDDPAGFTRDGFSQEREMADSEVPLYRKDEERSYQTRSYYQSKGDDFTNRTTGIAIALIIAIVCTIMIYVSANKKYTEATKSVEILQATQFIPAGQKLDSGMFKSINVPIQVAQNLATIAAGQFAIVPILQGQMLMKDDLAATGRGPGYVEVYVSVNVPSSACVMSGDIVDVYATGENNDPSVLLCARAEVLDVVDANAKETEQGKTSSIVSSVSSGGTAVAVGVAIPSDQAANVVGPASRKQIYLVKSAA